MLIIEAALDPRASLPSAEPSFQLSESGVTFSYASAALKKISPRFKSLLLS
jgi:hypothetical protein